MSRPQFRLRSLFILTAIVAVGCWVGPQIVREVQARLWPAPEFMLRTVRLADGAPVQASPPTE